MNERLDLDDAKLERAASRFIDASHAMAPENMTALVGEVRGLTPVGAEVTAFFRGVEAARAALGDGAQSAGLAVANLLESSRAVDAGASSALGDTPIVKGGTR